ncbi:2-oxoacid:acceptor oxidoreductase family protein [Pelotomaculum propionicicum]|uniref:NADH-dependent phenylglyoxylate dehydrogenase subunit gamma n=1 Tax=Pelotomaculum propionicicum TaxID=258475 RepID=A0A4Y7RVA3_9FIRM|nr:2-oxoacid:acceptor oxidoreductase family protein [Pelotomaculum propionicicum]NLI11690.1 2-oxoacid:ferredoxin oxidoreductase subunit gamma [Peptococcaceae bacterium]TEB12783.1 NADH-dependent phenylglyoxylate dehydrogenase subunit gamma [Pelotomaculum propionicicum]
MSQTSEILLSGTGGQGLIMAGLILADAVIRDGKNTVQTQSYGPEARGGASKAEVIISDEEIDYPKVTRPDVLLAMSQEALARYIGELGEDSVLIVDSTFIQEIPATTARTFKMPYTQIARESLGKEMVANIIALGALAAISGVVSKESLKSALLSRIPKGTEALNQKALEIGWESALKEAA